MKTIVIKESYIREQGWPESLIGAARLVRRENDREYKIVKQEGGYRTIPKEQIESVSLTVPAGTEEIKLPSNAVQLLEAAERMYYWNFRTPATLPGKIFAVVDVTFETVQVKDEVEEQHMIFVVDHKGSQLNIPAWCCIALEPVPFNENDKDGFVRKMGLEQYEETVKGFSEIVKVKQDGTFVTKDVWAGEQRFTIRRKVGKRGKLELVSKFGEYATAEGL